MTCKLVLYLKGAYYANKVIELSPDNDNLDEEQNCSIRESELKSAAEVFRIEHYRQIIKCQYEYDIVAIFESSIKNYGPEPDFN